MEHSQPKITIYSTASRQINAKLHGFAVNSSTLQLAHINCLELHVISLLADGGSVTLEGQASRSDNQRYNCLLSATREKAVETHLRN